MFFPPAQRPRLSQGVPFLGMALVGCLPGPLKRVYYRLRGAHIGRRVQFGIFSYIQSGDLVLADDVRIGSFTFIRARRCHIGARSAIHAFVAIDTRVLEIGEDSSILEQVTIGGMQTPRSALSVGSRSRIFSYSFLNPTEPIIIGDEVCIGGGTYVFTHGTWQSMLDGFPGSFGPVEIKHRVWIAWRSFIMPNVIVGEEATVGAGSIVTRDISPRTLAFGAPAKPVKSEGEYIAQRSDAERHGLMLQWFGEFAHYLTYLGWHVGYTQDDEGVTLRVPDCVIVYRRQTQPGLEADILCSFMPIAASERGAYPQGWFDLSAHQCMIGAHPLSAELRNFLMRYGVRFAVVEA